MPIAAATDSFYVALQHGLYAVQISDSTGSCHSISNGVTVGVNELSNKAGISIYPNPFDESITITTPKGFLNPLGVEPMEIIIYDIASRKLMEEKFIGSLSLNTRPLSQGVYLYELRDRSGVIERGKLVKE